MSQRIRIIGPDNPEFADAMNTLSDIWDFLDRQFAEDTHKSLQPSHITDQDVFSAATRMFSLRSDAPHGMDTAISPLVDTTGMLERAKGRELLHLSDNHVTYTKRLWDVSSRQVSIKQRALYVDIAPSSIRTGDIVELEVYFVAVERPDHSPAMNVRLQAVTLLDPSFTKACPLESCPPLSLIPPT
ncbi:hypothetical protein C8J57DRAFT_1185282 [Mycena rebaudengoi]|nr:hypothetical protein C8J57DRAFT_1185282 [Mycena rebaudengoi]